MEAITITNPKTAEQRDIMDIMRCVRDATEGTIVHVPEILNEGQVKKYIYKDNNWVFVKRMTQAEADEDDATSVTDETKLVEEAKKVPKPVVEAPFMLSDLMKAVEDLQLDAAMGMIERMIHMLGNDVMMKQDNQDHQEKSRKRGIKKRKSTEEGGAPKEKSAYHAFMSKMLMEMKGDKDIPRNQRMKIASQRWKAHVANSGSGDVA